MKGGNDGKINELLNVSNDKIIDTLLLMSWAW